MPRRETPLIRPGEKRNASTWFYGVGAAFVIVTLVLWLIWAFLAPDEQPEVAAPPDVQVAPLE